MVQIVWLAKFLFGNLLFRYIYSEGKIEVIVKIHEIKVQIYGIQPHVWESTGNLLVYLFISDLWFAINSVSASHEKLPNYACRCDPLCVIKNYLTTQTWAVLDTINMNELRAFDVNFEIPMYAQLEFRVKSTNGPQKCNLILARSRIQ